MSARARPSGSPGEVADNLARIRERIATACDRAGRDPGGVTVVAASKTVSLGAIRAAHRAGVVDFGENYVRELRDKQPALPQARWHFIGTVQTNTAHHVAALATVVETLARERATLRLARRAADARRALEALIEVDFTGRRSGVRAEAVDAFADTVVKLDGLRVVGLMTLPPFSESPEDARPFFRMLRELRDRIREKHPEVLELSMGMSLDYEVAVAEGATMVRIGTALFGPRTANA